MTLETEKLFRPPPPPDFTMLPAVAYKSRATKPAKPRLSGIEAERKDGIAGTETNADQSILAAISRLEAGLNEIRTKQNSYQSSNNSKKKREHYQEKRKPPPERTRESNESGSHPPTGDGRKGETSGELGHKNRGPFDPIKRYGCGRIGYRRAFCPECSGNEKRRD